MDFCFSGLDKGECSEEEIERAKSMVPKSLESYVEREYYISLFYVSQVTRCLHDL